MHPPLQEATVDALAEQKRVLLVAVVAELEELTRLSRPLASWARTALAQLDWLGKPVVLDSPSGTTLASEIQQDLAAGRSLRHALEHWGESAIISLASRATHLRPFMLSDDYYARIAAHVNGVETMSVHKFLHVLIVKGRITAQEAAAFSAALHHAGRIPDFTANELRSGRLRRVGEP